MKKLIILFLFIIISAFPSCAGFQVSSGIGFGVSGGPYGPLITPSINIGIYNGGYR